jgi:predicted transcriptional regulator
MNQDQTSVAENLTELAAEVVAAYVANNTVHISELPSLIADVHASLAKLGGAQPEALPEKLTPHMPIKKTIRPDHLISLEDGNQYKSLKRHLAGKGLTPEQYREKWGLPRDYPMISASYAAKRSELAKAGGLGQLRRKPVEPAPVKRGRAPKAA